MLDPQQATAAKVRVLITSTDGEDVWSTVGVSTDIIEASWIALVDSIEYKLLKSRNKQSEFTEGGSEYGDDDVPENTLRPRGA